MAGVMGHVKRLLASSMHVEIESICRQRAHAHYTRRDIKYLYQKDKEIPDPKLLGLCAVCHQLVAVSYPVFPANITYINEHLNA